MRPASMLPKYDGITRAGLDALEERWDIYWRDFGRCQHCGQSVTFEGSQVAHRIANTKANRHRWGSDVIDSMENKALTCSLYCNSRMNIGGNPIACREIAEKAKGE